MGPFGVCFSISERVDTRSAHVDHCYNLEIRPDVTSEEVTIYTYRCIIGNNVCLVRSTDAPMGRDGRSAATNHQTGTPTTRGQRAANAGGRSSLPLPLPLPLPSPPARDLRHVYRGTALDGERGNFLETRLKRLVVEGRGALAPDGPRGAQCDHTADRRHSLEALCRWCHQVARSFPSKAENSDASPTPARWIEVLGAAACGIGGMATRESPSARRRVNAAPASAPVRRNALRESVMQTGAGRKRHRG
jgi:hypothetical protein